VAQSRWTITPYLIVHDGAKAIDFYIRAFGAKEIVRYPMGNGKIGHAELHLHGEKLFLADDPDDANPRTAQGPDTLGDSPVTIHVAMPDVDTVFAQAVAAGAVVKWPVADQFYGDRSGLLVDPFGYNWLLTTHVRDISPDELRELTKVAVGSTND
jgi:PhnB protein